MMPIEIRLDPKVVNALLETIGPVMEELESELAASVEIPDDDEIMESFWKNDLLSSQREEIAVIAELFDDDFMESGRAFIAPEKMDRVLRACSAIRLKLRETVLGDLSDSQLEEGSFDEVHWTEDLQVAYAAYALFASLQELIVSQVEGEAFPADEEDEGGERRNGDDF